MAAVAFLAAQLASGQPFEWRVETAWYDPGLCRTAPINCFDPLYPYRMAAGHDAREWYGRALACPEEFPIGTMFTIENSRFGLADGERVCLDRGGMIVMRPDGTAVVDLLSRHPVWRERLVVSVRLPDDR